MENNSNKVLINENYKKHLINMQEDAYKNIYKYINEYMMINMHGEEPYCKYLTIKRALKNIFKEIEDKMYKEIENEMNFIENINN